MLLQPCLVEQRGTVAAFGWQPRTMRGAIFGVLNNKPGLEIIPTRLNSAEGTTFGDVFDRGVV